VREVSRKTAQDDESAPDTSSTTEVQRLQARVAELSAENQALRQQVAELQSQLHTQA
jgi:cell division protein FtsB